MNDFIYVEFKATLEEIDQLQCELRSIPDDDFIFLDQRTTWHPPHHIATISGKINSELASVLILQNSFLSQKMRISFIAESLKDMYRT